MWPWKQRGQKLDELNRRLDTLEAGFRTLKTEWLDMHEKLTAVDGRIRKRQERETAGEPTVQSRASVKEALRLRLGLRGGNGSAP